LDAVAEEEVITVDAEIKERVWDISLLANPLDTSSRLVETSP
jgi:hypothetical protein